jgi:hypothetical protein
MKCPVCGLQSPLDSSACDCGYDFNKQTGGYWPPFYIRQWPTLALVASVLFLVLCYLAGTILAALIIPHIILAAAWIAWARPISRRATLPSSEASAKVSLPQLDRTRSFRKSLVLVGLLAASLNIATFWALVIWQNLRPPRQSWWVVRDRVEHVSEFLIGIGICAASFGKGPGRVAAIVAALAGWVVWVTMHIGIL